MTQPEGPPTFHGADVRAAYAAPAPEEIAPARLRRPLATTVEDAVAPTVVSSLGRWLHSNRRDVVRAPTPEPRFEVLGFEDAAPDVAADLRRTILDHLPGALEVIGVPEFETTGVDLVPTLIHHQGSRPWSDGWDGVDGPEPMRRVGFELLTVTAEARFKGGELEFPNGDLVFPAPNRLAFFHPLQPLRVRPVECFSPDMLHGRWSVFGWVLGFPPEGWVDRVQRLRGG